MGEIADWPTEPAERVRELVEGVLDELDLDGDVEIVEDDDRITASVEGGDDYGLLIGKRGQTIDALQLLAYQAALRNDPKKRGGLRFDVHWKARKSTTLKLRIDGRGSKEEQTTNFNIEVPVKPPGLFSKWSALTLRGKDYEAIGELRSWRATLWDGEQLLAEQKSFLW